MADDYGTRYTDARLRDVKRRLDEVYKQAAREIDLKTQDFWRRHRIKDEIYRAQVARGKLDKEDYQAWMRGQIFQGDQWAAKREQIARTMTDADKIAQRIVDGEKTNIFATNANYIGYSLEKGAKANLGFGVYDSSTVARLIKDEPDLLPTINPEKVVEGEDIRWYQKTVTNSVTQGIIQGESIQQIFERIALTCADRAENAAMRDARTAYTGAQNAGRVEAMRQSQKLGIKVKKLWIATFDFKTRDTHRKLDGQTAEVDADFHVDGERIAYPGDPTAEPALVYNCRCTLGYNYPEYPSSLDRVDNITQETIGNMTYREWERMKLEEKISAVEPLRHISVDGVDISDTWKRRPDEFDFEINDVINAQGFDGKPRVVDADEFDRAVQDSGFIAQRSYSAPNQETLDAYRHQLYDGEWYVDCGTGGAQYGQGMYCAADYTGTLTDGIKNEMEHYRDLGESRYPNVGARSYTETLTFAPDAKVVTWREINDIRMGNLDMDYRTKEIERIVAAQGFTQDEATFVKYNLGTGVSWGEVDAAARRLTQERRNELVDKFYQIGEEATRRYNEEHDRRVERARIYQEKFHDIGSLAAALGYDAINAENHGQSGSYTVILNRTKVIFRRP